jgi:penicillin-binding protein 1A
MAGKSKDTEKATTNPYRRYVRLFWWLVLSPVLLIILVLSLITMEVFGDLPSIEELQNPKSNLASVVYSSDGKQIGKYYAENRTAVKYKDLDTNLISALVATEDARFYSHSGVDARGLARVVVRTILGGDEGGGGGSTVSQQLAKMLFPRKRDQNKFEIAVQKMKEWVIAVRLEKQYTKDEIIAMYLNKFDFLNNAVGIQSASQIYFNTTPDSLTIEQAATLVGMAKNPSIFNPASTQEWRRDTTEHRRNVVMMQMVNYGYLTRAQYDSLKKIPLKLTFRPEDHNKGLATYFREYLRDNFLERWVKENPKPDGTYYDVYRDGLRIYTTIDSRMQKYAEEAVAEHMKELQAAFFKDCKRKKNAPFAWNVTKDEISKIMSSAMKRSERYRVLKKAKVSDAEIEKIFNTPVEMTIFTWNGEKDTTMSPMDSIRYYKTFLQAGFMSMDPQTGYVKAWVGGIDHVHFKYDHVKVGRRQVGSTFKPFVYALAIQEGYSPCYRVPDVPVSIDIPGQPAWTPRNSDGKYSGKEITLQRALALSVNSVTAHITKQFGPRAIIDIARRMGVTSPMEPVPAICLGTPEISVYEMVGANSTFANRGRWTEPVFVTRIEDKNGKVLHEFVPRTEEVMSEEKAYIMLQLMKGVVQYGTGARLRFKYKITAPIAGKTGTTQNNSDGWFMGITPDLVSGCWVGAEDRSVHFSTTSEGQGASMALPIWAKYMQKVYGDTRLKISKGEFDKPSKKIEMEMDCKKYDQDMDSEEPEDFDNASFEGLFD